MATSQTYTQACSQVGSFSYAKYFTLYVVLTDRDGSSSTNISQVDYNVYCKSSGSGSLSGAYHTLYFSLNGNTIINQNKAITVSSPNANIPIASGSINIAHNDDGNKSIDFSASITCTGGYGVSASKSGSFALETIPRYANFTKFEIKSKTINTATISWGCNVAVDDCQYSLNGNEYKGTSISYPDYTITGLSPNTKYTIKLKAKRRDSGLWSESEIISVTTYDIAKINSVPNISIGNSHTITWSNPSGASTSLKLCKTDNSTIIDYGAVTGTSKAITPTANTIYALTPNSNTYTARYIITTTANSKSYTNYKDFTFTVTNSNPTFSNFTYQDTNSIITALTGDNQILVNGYSNVQATVSTANKATEKNNTTMSTYKLLIGTKSVTANYSSSADVNLSLDAVTSGTIDVYAMDSRGNSTKVTKTATIKNYSKIAITSLTATRANNVGTAVTLNFKATYWNESFGSVTNAISSCIYKYKETSASSYTTGETTLTYSISGNTITGSLSIKGDLGADGFNASNSYNIQLSITDKLSTTTSTVTLGSGNPAISVYKNNVAIGQKYDTSDGSKLQVNGITKFKDVTRLYKSSGDTGYFAKRTDTGTEVWMGVGSGGINHGVYSNTLGKWMIYGDGSNVYLNGNATSATKSTLSNKLENINGRIANANISHTYENDKAHIQLLLATSSMTSNKPIADGYILHCSWDNSGQYNGQLYLPNTNSNVPMQYRICNNGTWGNWEDVYRAKVLYNNTSGTTGTVTLSETSANFSYLEVYIFNNLSGSKTYQMERIYSPNGKNLTHCHTGTTSNICQVAWTSWKISGTTITSLGEQYFNINTTAGSIAWGAASTSSYHNYICRVVGYR